MIGNSNLTYNAKSFNYWSYNLLVSFYYFTISESLRFSMLTSFISFVKLPFILYICISNVLRFYFSQFKRVFKLLICFSSSLSWLSSILTNESDIGLFWYLLLSCFTLFLLFYKDIDTLLPLNSVISSSFLKEILFLIRVSWIYPYISLSFNSFWNFW
jgi:hypothetical protein